jgi:hypothetical protein
MLNVLLKALIGPFYRQHAGFFLAIGWLGFGFMRSGDHIALMQAALGANGFNMNAPGGSVAASWLLLLSYGLLWAGYTAKLSGFLRHQLTLPANRFLQVLQTRPPANRLIFWLVIVIVGLLPVLLYAGWMAQVGLAMQRTGAVWAMAVWLLLLTGAGVGSVEHRFVRPGRVAVGAGRWFGGRWAMPYPLIYPAYLLRQLPVSTALTKAGAGLLLTGIYRLYPTDDYDQRLLLIGTVLAIGIHAGLVWRLGAFEQMYLRLLPGLPLSRWQRFVGYALTYALLWLPELLISIWNRPADIGPVYVLLLWLFGWGSLLLIHRLTYGNDFPSDALMPWIIWSIIGGTLAIMFGLPAWVLAVGVWTLSVPILWGNQVR